MNPHVRSFSHCPLFQLSIACAVGIALSTYIPAKLTFLITGLAITTIVASVSILIDRTRFAGASLLLGVLLAASCLTVLQNRASPSQLKTLIDRRVVDAESVSLTGVITGPVEFAQDGIHFSVKADAVNTTTQSIKCSGMVAFTGYFRNNDDRERYRALQLQSGEHISVITKLDRTDQYRNPGVSMLTEYLDTKGIDAIGLVPGPEAILRATDSTGPSYTSGLYRWRAFLQRQFDTHFSLETAAVLSAALLGNRYNLSTTTADRFREGGTFHILVISGAHISFLGALVLLITRRLTARRWLHVGTSAAAVWLYTIAVGADVSVVRAAFMYSFVAVGHLLFRTSSPLNSLGAAALVLLAWSPQDIFDPSLQLTFLSVLAIVSIAWPILKTLQQIGSWRPTRTAPFPPQC